MADSKAMMEKAAELKAKADKWQDKSTKQRVEDVCELCGSRMETGEITKAKARHEEGKVHTGYKKVRDWLADIEKKLEELGEGDAKGKEGKDDKEKGKEGKDDKEKGKEGKDDKDRRRSR